MSAEPLHILILDDEVDLATEIDEFLTRKGFDTTITTAPETAYGQLSATTVDILILDVRLQGVSGLDVLKKVQLSWPDVEVIVVTGHGDMATVIESMRLGATDFLRKPFTDDELLVAIERTTKYLRLEHKLRLYKNHISLLSEDLKHRLGRHFVGESAAIQRVLDLALTASRHNTANILITGESGTGKEIIARIIHCSGTRKDSLFVPVHCAAVPATLLESEFFGYRKGAFTGATEDKPGYFEIANGGTLFLDEVAEMPVELQVKLLRTIEERRVRRLGDPRELAVDCSIIAASNVDVTAAVAKGKFRLDLLHRLQTIEIHLPALRDRVEDIEPLLIHFSRQLALRMNVPMPSFTRRTVELLQRYDFPGNVRELRNLVERAMIVATDGTIDNIAGLLAECRPALGGNAESLNLAETELRLVREALRRTGYNQQRASALLGISRIALIRRMKKHNIVVGRQLE